MIQLIFATVSSILHVTAWKQHANFWYNYFLTLLYISIFVHSLFLSWYISFSDLHYTLSLFFTCVYLNLSLHIKLFLLCLNFSSSSLISFCLSSFSRLLVYFFLLPFCVHFFFSFLSFLLPDDVFSSCVGLFSSSFHILHSRLC